jgi:hypothetical protein
MRWFKPHPEMPLREQLLEARDKLLRQIQITARGPMTGYTQSERETFENLTAELREALQQIEDALAEADNAQGS